MLKALSAAFRDMQFMPTGGVSAANLNEYLAVPSVIACGGSWLTPAAEIADGNFRRSIFGDGSPRHCTKILEGICPILLLNHAALEITGHERLHLGGGGFRRRRGQCCRVLEQLWLRRRFCRRASANGISVPRYKNCIASVSKPTLF